MIDAVMAAMREPIKQRPIFAIGMTVRVLSRIDVNMSKSLDHWLGAKCEVIGIIPRGLISKEWSYELLHQNGATCEFRDYELDKRYRLR